MKKVFLGIGIAFSIFSTSFAVLEDNSIIDELQNKNIKELKTNFNLQSFESCENLETVMEKYIKNYWEKNKNRYIGGPIFYGRDMILEDSAMEKSVNSVDDSQGAGGGAEQDFSKTNTQVEGVDESDIVKTDGKYIYYFNDKDKYVYIVKVGTLEIIKKIKIPANFYSPVLYIGNNRLSIISGGYSNYDYSKIGYWINRNSKTYTIIFDTTDIYNPKLSKLYISDGDFVNSRLIGDYLYVIANNSFNIPYYNFKAVDDINVSSSNLIPKSIELSKTSDTKKQNLELKGEKLPYNLKAGNVVNCNQIEYVLPDEETLSKYDFDPSYNIISVINTNDFSAEIKNKVIAGNNAEIHMSLDNLYLTSNLYSSFDYRCQVGFRCIMPWFPRGDNTVVHRISVDGNILKYNNSTIVPGSPLNQYSMDQYLDTFRIITQTNYPELSTNLYVLNKNDLSLAGSLTSIQPKEQFKSSRFIQDKLFLVTFERTDPFFAIDLSDSKNPKILGELKIPGYSTYLHPYDNNHIIGIGYDTKTNQWGGVINNGIKVDLYEINYNKKCGDSNLSLDEKTKCDLGDYKGIIVKQKYTKTLGGVGSYSEALDNPRMFMWKANANKLFLPMQLYTNAPTEDYRNIDFFQGLVTFTINKDTGIKEDFRLTHIDISKLEEKRQEECSKYTKETTEKKCVKLIGGGEYCEAQVYNYVPKYCYADSKIGEYLAAQSWNYYDQFIKRALWVGNDTYAISNSKITTSNINTGKNLNSVDLK